MHTAAEFAAAAEALVGTPWRRRSCRDPRAGVNCGGLLRAALAAVGIVVPDPPGYDAGMPPPAMLWDVCRAHGQDVPLADCGEGRVGLCTFQHEDEPRHLVVMLARRRIVHVDAIARRVTAVPAGWMDNRLAAVFRVRGLEYGAPW